MISKDSAPYKGSKLVTINQACALALVTRRTLYNWLHAGKLSFTRTAGGSVRIYEDSLHQGPSFLQGE